MLFSSLFCFPRSYFYFSIVDGVGLQYESKMPERLSVSNGVSPKKKDKSNSKCDGAEKSFWQRQARVCDREIVRCDGGGKKNVKTHTWSYSHWIKCNVQQECSGNICWLDISKGEHNFISMSFNNTMMTTGQRKLFFFFFSGPTGVLWMLMSQSNSYS